MKGRAARRIFYSADNGGTDRGSNWPLRGSKHSNCALFLSFQQHLSCMQALLRWVFVDWAGEGGMRAAAFVSGGLIPAALRGTHSHVAGHIADWCAPSPPDRPCHIQPWDFLS